MKKIVAAGAVIVVDGKLLVSKDSKDNFYKIPGGKVEEDETLEECVVREFKEETGFSCKVLEKLSTNHLTKKPGAEEKIDIFLYHFKSEFKGDFDFDSFENKGHEIKWIEVDKLNEFDIAPNILFLKEKGEL